MADINKRVPDDCDDDCAGEHGKRGRRGHRGHRGQDGNDGATGPTGPTGPGLNTAVGRFDISSAQGGVTITRQSGQFAFAVYNGIGDYTVHLNPIPGLTQLDIVAVGTVIDPAGGFTLTDAPGFSVDHVIIGIRITDSAGTLIDRPFYLNVALLGG